MDQMMQGMNGMLGAAWLIWILVIVALLLAVAALIKYLFFSAPRGTDVSPSSSKPKEPR